MNTVISGLFVGTERDCQRGNHKLALVHACKTPCHQRAVGYCGTLQQSHPNYLVLEHEFDLYLNIIDPPIPLFRVELFTAFLAFAQSHWLRGRQLLIHCNQGESRAPMLAFLFLARVDRSIPSSTFHDGFAHFKQLYPNVNPGRGITTFMEQHWDELLLA